MKYLYVTIALLISLALNAQHTISGTFSPPRDYTWLIAYRLKSDSQSYIADTGIKNGKFSLKIPAGTTTGVYRLVYAVPQDEFYFDVIYNGKEDIQLAFDATKGVSFVSSQENILFNSYFKQVNDLEQEIAAFYNAGHTDKNEFSVLTKKLQLLQTDYETKSKGLIAHDFIDANCPYVPAKYESVHEYLDHKKAQYFTKIDFYNPVLQSSGFLMDKATNYVLTMLPLKKLSATEKEHEMIANIKSLHSQMQNVDAGFATQLYHSLWTKLSDKNDNAAADFVYDNYLKSLATETHSKKIIDEIEVHNRLRLGAVAPEITWKDGNTTKKLSELSGAKNYLLIFWSSTCSHCLHELPILHKQIKPYLPFTKVVAVGLEDDAASWEKESAKLTGFIHTYSLKKWESRYARLYDIHKTPTFYILDSNKRIIAKPEDNYGVIDFLKKHS